MEYDDLTNKVIGSAIEVHRQLGPGLLESTYQACLLHELRSNGITCENEVPVPVVYKRIKLECGYRADILVEGKLVIELKSVESIARIHIAQLLTYLKLGGFYRGVIINFNTEVLKDGIRVFDNRFKKELTDR